MPFFPSPIRRFAVAASLLIGFGASTVSAGLIDPELKIEWWVNSAYVGELAPNGVFDSTHQWWHYNGFASDLNTGVNLNFDLNADADPLISGNLTVENPFLPVVNVKLVVTLPVAPTLPNGSLMQGSAAVGLTTEGGGSLSTLAGKPLWRGMIDGSAVGPSASLFFDPFALTNASTGSSGTSGNFGAPFMVPGPAVLSSIGIEINFSITQNDQGSFTSVFYVIPAPGAIALLGFGGLIGTGRRRRR